MTLDLMGAALEAADDALANGELPIGAVVAVGDEIVARAHTADLGAARRLAHAEMLALTAADRILGWGGRAGTRRTECRDLYRRWLETAPAGSGFRPFASVMAGLPDAA